ncbi:hypothetical protein [Variovorax sp. GB1P17]
MLLDHHDTGLGQLGNSEAVNACVDEIGDDSGKVMWRLLQEDENGAKK